MKKKLKWMLPMAALLILMAVSLEARHNGPGGCLWTWRIELRNGSVQTGTNPDPAGCAIDYFDARANVYAPDIAAILFCEPNALCDVPTLQDEGF